MDPRHRIALRLRVLRTGHGLTQEQFAEAIDRSVDAVSNLERGLSLPGLDTLIRISERFAVPLTDLVASIDPTAPPDPERLALEAALTDLCRRLSARDLARAVALVRVLADTATA